MRAADTKVNNTQFLSSTSLETREKDREGEREAERKCKGKREKGRKRKKGRERRNENYLQSVARKMIVNSTGIGRRTRREEKAREENFESHLETYKKEGRVVLNHCVEQCMGATIVVVCGAVVSIQQPWSAPALSVHSTPVKSPAWVDDMGEMLRSSSVTRARKCEMRMLAGITIVAPCLTKTIIEK